MTTSRRNGAARLPQAAPSKTLARRAVSPVYKKSIPALRKKGVRRLGDDVLKAQAMLFPKRGTRAVSKIDVTQERIDAELRTLAQHQKVFLELDQVLAHRNRTRLEPDQADGGNS